MKIELLDFGPGNQQGESYPLFHAREQEPLRVVGLAGDPSLITRTGICPGSILKMRRVGSSCLVLVTGKRNPLCLCRRLCKRIIVQPVRLQRVSSSRVR